MDVGPRGIRAGTTSLVNGTISKGGWLYHLGISGLVMTSYIYKTAFVYKEMGYAAALSFVLFLLILVVSVVQQRLNKVDWEY